MFVNDMFGKELGGYFMVDSQIDFSVLKYKKN